VVLTGSHRVWEYPYSPLVRYGQTMTMQVLKPINASQLADRAGELESEMKQLALASSVSPRHFDPEVDGYWDDYDYEIDPDFPQVAELVARHRAGRP
jgi:1-acyl-sn-glycerol-3-phosphate acyltransferase